MGKAKFWGKIGLENRKFRQKYLKIMHKHQKYVQKLPKNFSI